MSLSQSSKSKLELDAPRPTTTAQKQVVEMRLIMLQQLGFLTSLDDRSYRCIFIETIWHFFLF